MNDSATPSRTARIVDALAQAERIEQLIRDARDIEPHDRPAAAQALDEAIAATRELPDLHELHAVGERVWCCARRDTRGGARV